MRRNISSKAHAGQVMCKNSNLIIFRQFTSQNFSNHPVSRRGSRGGVLRDEGKDVLVMRTDMGMEHSDSSGHNK